MPDNFRQGEPVGEVCLGRHTELDQPCWKDLLKWTCKKRNREIDGTCRYQKQFGELSTVRLEQQDDRLLNMESQLACSQMCERFQSHARWRSTLKHTRSSPTISFLPTLYSYSLPALRNTRYIQLLPHNGDQRLNIILNFLSAGKH